MLEEIGLLKAGEAASDRYPALDKDLSLSNVLRALDKAGVDRAMLLEKKEARGIITLRDILYKLATERTRQASISALHASSFMSEPVISVGPNDPLVKATKLMVENNITSVPVVDSSSYTGVMVGRYELARLLSETPKAADIPVKEYMRTPTVSVNLQTRILHVRQLIFQHDLSVIPVLEDGRFVGVVGVDELATIFVKYYDLARGEPKNITPLKYVIVADAIRMRPPRLDPDASLAEAARQIYDSGYRAVIIIDNDKPVGIVSGLELAKAIAGL